MTNDERCILQAVISELYEWTRLFTHGSIPIDTPQWLDTYDGMGPSGSGATDLDSKFQDVLRIASKSFPTFKFRLRFPEKEQEEKKARGEFVGCEVSCRYKAYLEYTKFIFPEEQE